MKRTFLIISAVAIAILILIFIKYNDLFKIYLNDSDQTFHSDEWKANVENRIYMVDDLLDEIDFRGMAESDVILLLGKPNNRNDTSLLFELGNKEKGFGVEYAELLIIVSNDTVTTAEKIGWVD